MNFPLKSRVVGGYRFREMTTYSAHHLGTDWRANYVNLYAPTDGEVLKAPWGTEGGQWLYFKNSFGNIHRFAHLSKVIVSKGKVKAGDVIGVTGNTGKFTTSAHLHEDITKAGLDVNIYYINNFIDPEEFYNNLNKPMAKTYYIKSDLRNALKELDKDFDHEKASDHEKMAKKVEDMIDRAVIAEQEAIDLKEELELKRKEIVNLNGTIFNRDNDIKNKTALIEKLNGTITDLKLAEKEAPKTLGYHFLAIWSIIKDIKLTK
jgi:septal ring factor EnvC (AmiA/AmiB activator)